MKEEEEQDEKMEVVDFFLLVQIGNDSRNASSYYSLLLTYCPFVVVGRIRDSMSRTLRIRSASFSNFEGSENRFSRSRTDPNRSSYFHARSRRRAHCKSVTYIHSTLLYTFFFVSLLLRMSYLPLLCVTL